MCQDDPATDATDAPAADPAADATAGRSLDRRAVTPEFSTGVLAVYSSYSRIQIFLYHYIALYQLLRESIMP